MLVGKLYQPEHLIETKNGTKKLTKTTCVASAKSDNLRTIKQQVLYAAKKEGLTSIHVFIWLQMVVKIAGKQPHY